MVRVVGVGIGAWIHCLGKRKTRLNGFHICCGNESRLTQIAFPLWALLSKNVAFPLFPTQDLPCARHLESLGDGLTGFCCTF